MGPDKLPAGKQPVPPQADFREARAVAGWQVDNCFGGWTGEAELVHAAHRVRLRADCAWLVCYSPSAPGAPGVGSGFLALEPVSHVNNAFQLAATGVGDTGMRLLAPGEDMALAADIFVLPT
jgi:aldose 1-epimerase